MEISRLLCHNPAQQDPVLEHFESSRPGNAAKGAWIVSSMWVPEANSVEFHAREREKSLDRIAKVLSSSLMILSDIALC